MNNNTKFELAKEILTRAMAVATENGFNPNDPVQAQLLEDEKQLNLFDEKTIEKIIKEYGPVVKIGGING